MKDMEAGPLFRVNPSLGTHFASGTFRLGQVLPVFSFLTHLQFALYVHPRRVPCVSHSGVHVPALEAGALCALGSWPGCGADPCLTGRECHAGCTHCLDGRLLSPLLYSYSAPDFEGRSCLFPRKMS